MSRAAATEFVSLLKRLHLLISQHIDESLREYGIARSQFQVLFHLQKQGSLTQRQLMEIMKIEPATLCGITDVLERKGWLARQADANDKRQKSLRLTPSGQKILASIPHPAEQISRRMLAGFDTAERQKFKSFITKSIANLENNQGE